MKKMLIAWESLKKLAIMGFILTSCLLLFASCEKNNSNDSIRDSLQGIWKLSSIKNKQNNSFKYFPDTLDKEITIEFKSTNIVSLKGYCNTGSANYIINDNRVLFNNVILTEIGCSPVGGEWEMYLFELSNVTDFKQNNIDLHLITDSEIDLYFSKVDL